MTDKDQEFARKITACLDQGAAELKAGTAYRLQVARAAALSRLTDPKRAPESRFVPAIAGSGGGTVGGGRGFRTGARLWLGIALIVAAGIGFQQWQAWQQLKEIEETDTAILSSDLPIDAYLDRGFQNWLKTLGDD